MKIVQRKISELKSAEYNPRQLSRTEYADLKRSLQEFGFVDPVIINVNADRKDMIIGGHQRLRIWKDLGNDTVPCVQIDLTPQKERELNIRLNKNTGSWDYDALANFFEMDDLIDWGFKQSELVFSTESDQEDDEDMNGDIIPEMEVRQYEHHDYICLIFNESHDYLFACQRFGVKKIRIPEKKRLGIGRVIDGKQTLMRLFPNEFKHFQENHSE